MNSKKITISRKDINALLKIINLTKQFIKKNIIYRDQKILNRIEKKFKKLQNTKDLESSKNLFERILQDLTQIIRREISSEIYYLVGGHGGIIIDDIGFCEFDSPSYAIDSLLEKMELALEFNLSYNLEISISCLEWLEKNIPDKFTRFIDLFKKGKFEILNPTYTQPYNLIIGSESNIKQFAYGLNFLSKHGINSRIYYCSESSLHPQIPQLLSKFNIKYGSLKTRLLGSTPTANYPKISWLGLDDTSIESIIDLSGLFNGEYWHGTFFKELPNLLFQTVSKPFMKIITYSSIEDFILKQPYLEEIWRISKHSDIFGIFMLFSDFLDNFDVDGKYKYNRDNFQLGESIFLPSDLFLHNKTSETSILKAEILYSILGTYLDKDYDSFFIEIWKDLLLTQSHDCFAVPYIRHGDYSQFQLSKKDFSKIKVDDSKKVISELSKEKHKEIQKRCEEFIEMGLTKTIENLNTEGRSLKDSRSALNILIFNPTPYFREDIIEIELNNYKNLDFHHLFHKKEEIESMIEDNKLKTVVKIPGFGYKIYKIKEKERKNEEIPNSNYYYDLKISKDQKTIEIIYKKVKICSLKFKLNEDYELKLNKKEANQIQEKFEYIGKTKGNNFKLKIYQFQNVNRLEFFLESGSLQEIILIPEIKIQKCLINYPFGIEETKRNSIQTLDFLWLRNQEYEIIHMNKNSQRFKINHTTYKSRNILTKKGSYEFAIVITNKREFVNPLFYVDSFNKKLVGKISSYDLTDHSNSYLKIDCKEFIRVINLWRRENKTFLRLFNPTNQNQKVILKGKIINHLLIELDFNDNIISKMKSNVFNLKPWEIKTIQI